jgi:hypothetical protein
MKNKLIAVIFLIIPLASMAQGNLQFNQILNFQGELTTTNPNSPEYTVPAGKVWKIEYCTPFKFAGQFDPPPSIALYLNGVPLDVATTNGIWLKANSIIQYKNSSFYTSTSATYQAQYYKALRSYALSIIEYNIIP